MKLSERKDLSNMGKLDFRGGYSKTKQYYGFDAVKLIAAIFVVAIHTSPMIRYDGTAFFYFYDAIIRMAVPFFFMVWYSSCFYRNVVEASGSR